MTGRSGERVLYEERLWWPMRTWVLVTAYAEAVVLVLVIVGHPDTISTILGFATATGGGAFWIAYLQLMVRRQRHRVGERTLKFGRCKPFPVEALRRVQLVSGRAEVDRVRTRLTRGQKIIGATFNPTLKGLLAPPRVENAVLLQVDPAASPTHTFLLGTRHPEQLFGALEETLRAAELRGIQCGDLVAH